MKNLKQIIEIIIGIVFIIFIGWMLISIWSDNFPWTYPKEDIIEGADYIPW